MKHTAVVALAIVAGLFTWFMAFMVNLAWWAESIRINPPVGWSEPHRIVFWDGNGPGMIWWASAFRDGEMIQATITYRYIPAHEESVTTFFRDGREKLPPGSSNFFFGNTVAPKPNGYQDDTSK